MEKEHFDLEKSELQKSTEIADIFQNPLWDYIGCIFPIGGIIGVEDGMTEEFKGARRKDAEQEEIKNLVPEMKPMSNEQIDKIVDEIFYKDEL